MKVLVTGIQGQLGHDVMEECRKRGHDAVGVDVEEMDITDEGKVREVVSRVCPEAVVHCAAYTAVDKAEDEEEICRLVNGKGTENIAKICREQDCKLLYLSTDYVFQGEGERPWEPEDAPHPLNVYGQTKYEGEQAIRHYVEKYFILRISWVFGVNGGNFVKTMLRLGRENGAVKVVDDQIGSPTYTRDLSVLLVDMMESERYGIYHATNEGFCSWYEFALAIFEEAGLEVEVTPVDSSSFPAKAKRPYNSRMNKEKLVKSGFNKLPTWQDALKRYLQELES
ncbi:MAG: dTDP-4-dehydrorhamnose reductase [Lachnospiraceae bacterium]|nr:dTDP-4-dehydrorhamnose reductase [Lachnospiraceae bacterium]